MAAGKDQLQSFVGECRRVHRFLLRHRQLEQAGLLGQRAIATDAIDRPVARGRDQPGIGAGREAFAGPALGGNRERLLGGFLGEVDIAEEADQCGEDPSPLLMEGLLEDC
jgi:hypothetical protein